MNKKRIKSIHDEDFDMGVPAMNVLPDQDEPRSVLDEIQEFAYRYLDIQEISTITQVPVEQFQDNTPEHLAFQTGRLLRKAKFNENIIKLTDQLSSPAMAIEVKLSEAAHINDTFQ